MPVQLKMFPPMNFSYDLDLDGFKNHQIKHLCQKSSQLIIIFQTHTCTAISNNTHTFWRVYWVRTHSRSAQKCCTYYSLFTDQL